MRPSEGMEMVPSKEPDETDPESPLPATVDKQSDDGSIHGKREGKVEEDEEEPKKLTIRQQIAAIPDNFLKQADQSSPLWLAKMPRWIGFTVAILLFGSYCVGFFYQLGIMYGNCTVENNCISCAITAEAEPGSDCQRLADTQLNVRAGCISVGIPNDKEIILDILDGTRTLIEEWEEESDIDARLVESLHRHGEIVDALQFNSRGQMVDPDASKLKDFFKDNFVGFTNDLLADDGFGPAPLDEVDDAVVVAAGLKTLYSYIAIGTVLNHKDGDRIITVRKAAADTTSGLNYTGAMVCGCSMKCPTTKAVLVGAIDPSMSVSGAQLNGLGQLEMFVPNNYVQDSSLSTLDRQAAVAEWIYFPDGPIGGPYAPAHCSVSAFTNTPASINSALYECCTEKSNLEKLSETSAFAGLVLTFAIVATTLLFWPWSPKQEDSVTLALKDELMGILG